MNSTTDTECPLGDCCGEGEYITRQIDFKGNNFELDPATTCYFGRRCNGLRDLHVHKARSCK